MIVFHSDLDNTLIYSYRHNIGKDKTCVEVYQGRDISFMTAKSLYLLKQIREKAVFVPTTTRTAEQYHRIDMGVGAVSHALVCNGGVLLLDGKEDMDWYRDSLKLVSDCQGELETAERYLDMDPDRIMRVRNIRNLFLFTKSGRPDRSVRKLREVLDLSKVDLFCNGTKVYVVPKKLNKGTALRRFREWMQPKTVLAAGDSIFDIPMLMEADIALMPEALAEGQRKLEHIMVVGREKIFSEAVLEYVAGSI